MEWLLCAQILEKPGEERLQAPEGANCAGAPPLGWAEDTARVGAGIYRGQQTGSATDKCGARGCRLHENQLPASSPFLPSVYGDLHLQFRIETRSALLDGSEMESGSVGDGLMWSSPSKSSSFRDIAVRL
jgi:hypothetical protein